MYTNFLLLLSFVLFGFFRLLSNHSLHRLPFSLTLILNGDDNAGVVTGALIYGVGLSIDVRNTIISTVVSLIFDCSFVAHYSICEDDVCCGQGGNFAEAAGRFHLDACGCTFRFDQSRLCRYSGIQIASIFISDVVQTEERPEESDGVVDRTLTTLSSSG